ncbi:glycosyltransferase family 2 protein [Winogradskyella luteola]|uniref:Glycosyltransferase family 2 protein n=1 Tax=Winogradskyella luteola TaxID=2828330 RepID=A0A9X1F983_9FLAO|nr:glycosyltransferase family 2 protein [Winogradskyella luteola]MBV7269519.1 glycosyltransferase family 2 protein [Winogradskyella luteola]
MKIPNISVIISTYNAEDWLEKVLWSYNAQSFAAFEVIIADDGSREATRKLIESMRPYLDFDIVHVWHEDHGFQKSKILNKALLECKSDYILMSDGDCIARADFVETHFCNREKGYFLSGGYYKLPMSISKLITRKDIIDQNCFDLNWLKSKGLKSSFKNNKLNSKGLKSKLLNFITPTNASWNGHNSSGWKSDIYHVNGLDVTMQYGGQDRELGERLMNLGIKSKQIRYSAVCLHLDHDRGYKNEASIEKNRAIRHHTKKTKKIWTDNGIVDTNDIDKITKLHFPKKTVELQD